MAGKLFVVATPIGNLDDITSRAIKTLKEVDFIAAEDTRVSLNLVNHFDIGTKLISYHKFNEREKSLFFLGKLNGGMNIALISDAGTPCISDPGYILVKAAVEQGIEVVGVCGACAAITAVSVSGFFVSSFSFMGFLPKESAKIKKELLSIIKGSTSILVYYESPRRIIKTIALFEEYLSNCLICLCNDLTKKFERIYRGNPREVLSQLKENEFAEKGEYCIVVSKSECAEIVIAQEITAEAMIVNAMVKNSITIKDAVKLLSNDSNINYSKNQLFDAGLELKKLLQ